MKKYLLSIAALLLGLLAHSQEADDLGNYAEVSIIPRLDVNPIFGNEPEPDVRFVIHYDMPKSLEGYYQETGRAGRDDGEGLCIAFYDQKDLNKLEKFSAKKSVSEQEIVKQLLAETASYAESTNCRRKHLLHYFGENYTEENCHNCDNCNHPKPKMDASEQIQLLLEVILAVKQQFKEDQIVDIICGNKTTSILKFHHEKLKQFGEGMDYDAKFWSNVVRVSIFDNLIAKDIENYGLLKITDKGKKYMTNPYPIMAIKPVTEEDEPIRPARPRTGKGKSSS